MSASSMRSALPCSAVQRPLAAARPLAAPAARHPAVAGGWAAQPLSGRSSFAALLRVRQRPAAQQPGRGSRLAVQAVGRGSGPDIPDRVIGSIPYLIPLFDGLRYGKFFLRQFPIFADLLYPLEPLIRAYFSFPLAGLIVFFAVYLGVAQNFRFSRFVRYNAMQAILLDIMLILPGLIESVVGRGGAPSGAFLQLYITGYNTIFLFTFACVAYGVGSSLSGQLARLPIVSDAADAQVP